MYWETRNMKISTTFLIIVVIKGLIHDLCNCHLQYAIMNRLFTFRNCVWTRWRENVYVVWETRRIGYSIGRYGIARFHFTFDQLSEGVRPATIVPFLPHIITRIAVPFLDGPNVAVWADILNLIPHGAHHFLG